MSSKKRRKAREWMHAERRRAEQAVTQAVTDTAKRVRTDLTRMIPREDPERRDRFFYPQGKLDQPYIRLATAPDLFEPFADFVHSHLMRELEVFTLRAKQFALTLPDRTTVVWWGWELA